MTLTTNLMPVIFKAYTKRSKLCINYFSIVYLVIFSFSALPLDALSQDNVMLSPTAIKKLSLEELMNIEVTSVSKSPEKLTEVASAIQVITSEDIRRSSTTRLPDALRLASNLQVARSNAHNWAITARGFNAAPLSVNTLSDKLLVMIDGRTVYEPLLGGVSWDSQNILMEDIDRIEVVSGPGGTLWGANAINGVINVNSKSAKETQGLYASGSYGEFFKDFGAVRYGSHIDSTLFFRVYGQRYDNESSKLLNGNSANDQWDMTQGGFRMDYLPSDNTTITFQGDLYKGKQNTPSTHLDGQNVIGRLSHSFSEKSNISLQFYYDRTWRNSTAGSTFKSLINTYDADFQHHLAIGSRNRILWGTGYRIMDNRVNRAFDPPHKTLKLFNAFIQDQIALVPNLVELTLGTKLLHNDYTSFEWQPSIRLAWTPLSKLTVWTAVSRAVRTPSRFDADLTSASSPTEPFKSEKVIAYEMGYRIRPIQKISLSIATFYNTYTDLRSFNTRLPQSGFVLANNQEAKTWGIEISGNAVVSSWWRLRGGYTFLKKEFKSTSANVYEYSSLIEALDPNNQVMLQSILDLPKHFQLDFDSRYVDKIVITPTSSVPSYFIFDARLAWEHKTISIALIGQNLIKKTNREFTSGQIPRSLFANLTVRF